MSDQNEQSEDVPEVGSDGLLGAGLRMQKWEPETNQRVLRRVGKTGEEASELLKVLQRIIIQGYSGSDPETGETNQESLTKEIADVYAQLDETVEALELNEQFIESRRQVKRGYMKDWEAHFQGT